MQLKNTPITNEMIDCAKQEIATVQWIADCFGVN